MRRWYYENGAGLLLSHDAQALWAKIRASLEKEPPVKHLALRKRSTDVVGTGFAWPPPETET
jgi:hypothetical protein